MMSTQAVDCRGVDKGTFKQSAWVPPSPTLYITNIPATRHALEGLESVLKQQEGFMAPIRTAKGGAIAFADFAGVQMATNAMNRLRGLQVCGNVPNGIQFSYDKDDSEEKRKEKEAKHVMYEAMKLCQQYHCRLCGAFVIKLSKPLDKLPKRNTDSSYVVSESKQLVELSACKGEVKHIKREKGVEQQCRLKCDGCGVVIGYRPTPMGDPSPFLYVLPDSLTPITPHQPKDSGRGHGSPRTEFRDARMAAGVAVGMHGSGSVSNGSGFSPGTRAEAEGAEGAASDKIRKASDEAGVGESVGAGADEESASKRVKTEHTV